MQIFVPEISHYLLQYLLFYLQVFMYVCVYTTVNRWESEDTLQDLLFSLHYAWYRDRTQVVKFDSKEALLPGTNLFYKEASYYVFHTILELPVILLQPMGCLDYRHIHHTQLHNNILIGGYSEYLDIFDP